MCVCFRGVSLNVGAMTQLNILRCIWKYLWQWSDKDKHMQCNILLYSQTGFRWNANCNVLQDCYKAADYVCLEHNTVQCGRNLWMFQSELVPPCSGRKNALDSHCCENLKLCMECPHGTHCSLVAWGQVPWFCSQCCNVLSFLYHRAGCVCHLFCYSCLVWIHFWE